MESEFAPTNGPELPNINSRIGGSNQLPCGTVQNAGGISRAETPIRVLWTDTGVYMGKRPDHLQNWQSAMFKSFDDSINPVAAGVPTAGQILIPMPDNQHLPKTAAEWNQFSAQLKAGMMQRIDAALAQGVTNFEIRTVQNITIKTGYWTNLLGGFPLSQQARSVKFGTAFLKALAEVRAELAAHHSVEVTGMAGSNGGFLATESISRMGSSPLDKLILVDARAYLTSTLKTAKIMNGNVVIVNTGGDAPSLTWMIANHSTSQMLKLLNPRVSVFYTDPKGWNIPASAHIAIMMANPSSTLVVKEGQGFTHGPKTTMTMADFRQLLLRTHGQSTGQAAHTRQAAEIQPCHESSPGSGQSAQADQLGGVSFQMQVNPDSIRSDDRAELRRRRQKILNKPRKP